MNHVDVANSFSALEGLETSSVDDTWVKIRDSIKGFCLLLNDMIENISDFLIPYYISHSISGADVI